MNYVSDIPMTLAVAAFSGTSFVPEKRGQSVVSEYGSALESIYATLRAHAEKGGTLDQLAGEFSRLRAGYGERYRAWLSSRGNCVSTMIAGPSNFPARRMQKRFGIADRRSQELVDFKARAMRAAIRNLRPDLRPIMAGDADAIERLETEIARAEAVQERMKAANAAIRKHKGEAARVLALIDVGFSESQARRLLIPNCFNAIGFADYELKNNGANVRRMKQRLEQISRAKATPDSQIAGENGVTLDDCPAENRVRLTFPGKPSEEIRTKLKKNGFRWTPSLGVWQAYRNAWSIELAKQMVAGGASC